MLSSTAAKCTLSLCCFIYSPFLQPLWGCVPTVQIQLCCSWWKKKMFLSQNLPCIKTHTNTLLFTGSCWVSHGMIIVSRGSMFFLTCCLRKTFPLRLNIEKTLSGQSHMPANHLTTTAAYWKSMATKKNLWHQIFSVPGENYVHNITKRLVYPFLPRTDNTGFGACSRK